MTVTPGVPRDRDRIITGAFDVGVVLKNIDRVLEIVGGLLLIVPLASSQHFLIWVTGKELSEDPGDFVATHPVHLANTLSVSGCRLTIADLLVHGLVKVSLVVMLLKGRLWSYSTAIAIFAAFCVFQVYQFSFSHSLLLLALTVMDVLVIVLTVWEYRILLRQDRAATAAVDASLG